MEESSRVFISGLPLTLSTNELRQHFGSHFQVTDTHVVRNRRIGFVGFKNPSTAQEAVNYFNKSYIRMSKISVTIAKPVEADAESTSTSRPVGTPLAASDKISATVSLKRKRDAQEAPKNAKLEEYLETMQRPSNKRTWADTGLQVDFSQNQVHIETKPTPSAELNFSANVAAEHENDKPKAKGRRVAEASARLNTRGPHIVDTGSTVLVEESTAEKSRLMDTEPSQEPAGHDQNQSDADWLRSRTSRLLGLLDENEEDGVFSGPPRASRNVGETDHKNHDDQGSDGADATDVAKKGSAGNDVEDSGSGDKGSAADPNLELLQKTGRLFVRNLSYESTESDLEQLFSPFGKTEEVHVAFDTRFETSKGFAYIQYLDPDAAVQAYKALDGKVWQGRLLHVLPASSKKTYKLNDYELSKLPFKKQQKIKRRQQSASSAFNWNSLYMNADAVMESIAERMGVPKSELLDPTSSNAAVKQAHAETHVIQETKAYFAANGVNFDAFKQRERGNTAILVKNFSYGIKADDLRKLFETYGEIVRLLMPPSGTIAIVEFRMPDEAQNAFKTLAYRKLGDSILFLEKAPKDLIDSKSAVTSTAVPEPAQKAVTQGFSTSDTFKADEPEPHLETSTLFVRNLNFSTTSAGLAEVFEPLDGFLSATVKMKPDPKRRGQTLSMGFGFVEFRSRSQAQAALAAMNGYKLDKHELAIAPSHRGADAAEQQRREDTAKMIAARRTKIIIKNLPFQASKKDVRTLFGAYGKLRSVRVPKKFDHTARGFAFAVFLSAREAENAMDALRNTHLLGRRLVLEFASDEAVDPEEEIQKIERKVGAQVNRVKMQQLTGSGRKKFNFGADVDEEG